VHLIGIILVCLITTISHAKSSQIHSEAQQIYYPIRTELTFKGGNQRSLTRLGVLAPLYSNPGNLVFFNGFGLMDFRNHQEGNFGLGYRKMFSDIILGGYGFYDIRRTQLGSTFSQITFGAELLKERVELRGNIYLPLTGKQLVATSTTTSRVGLTTLSISSQLFEYALTGFDVETGVGLTPKNELQGFVSYYHFYGAGKSMDGVRTRTQYHITPHITLEGEVSYDNLRKTNYLFGIRFNYTFGCKTSKPLSILEQKMTQMVERDIDLIIVKNQVFQKPFVTNTTKTNDLTASDQVYPGDTPGFDPNPYDLLGLPSSVSDEKLRKRYDELMLEHQTKNNKEAQVNQYNALQKAYSIILALRKGATKIPETKPHHPTPTTKPKSTSAPQPAEPSSIVIRTFNQLRDNKRPAATSIKISANGTVEVKTTNRGWVRVQPYQLTRFPRDIKDYPGFIKSPSEMWFSVSPVSDGSFAIKANIRARGGAGGEAQAGSSSERVYTNSKTTENTGGAGMREKIQEFIAQLQSDWKTIDYREIGHITDEEREAIDSAVLALINGNYKIIYNKGKREETLAHLCAALGLIKSFKRIAKIDVGALSVEDGESATVVHYAAEHGRLDILMFLTFQMNLRELLKAIDEDGYTIAHSAALKGRVNVLEFLASQNDLRGLLKAPNYTGGTIADLAAMQGRLNVFQFLASQDDLRELLKATGEYGYNIAHGAADYGQTNVLTFLASQEDLRELLIAANNRGEIPIITLSKQTIEPVSKVELTKLISVIAVFSNEETLVKVISSMDDYQRQDLFPDVPNVTAWLREKYPRIADIQGALNKAGNELTAAYVLVKKIRGASKELGAETRILQKKEKAVDSKAQIADMKGELDAKSEKIHAALIQADKKINKLHDVFEFVGHAEYAKLAALNYQYMTFNREGITQETMNEAYQRLTEIEPILSDLPEKDINTLNLKFQMGSDYIALAGILDAEKKGKEQALAKYRFKGLKYLLESGEDVLKLRENWPDSFAAYTEGAFVESVQSLEKRSKHTIRESFDDDFFIIQKSAGSLLIHLQATKVLFLSPKDNSLESFYSTGENALTLINDFLIKYWKLVNTTSDTILTFTSTMNNVYENWITVKEPTLGWIPLITGYQRAIAEILTKALDESVKDEKFYQELDIITATLFSWKKLVPSEPLKVKGKKAKIRARGGAGDEAKASSSSDMVYTNSKKGVASERIDMRDDVLKFISVIQSGWKMIFYWGGSFNDITTEERDAIDSTVLALINDNKGVIYEKGEMLGNTLAHQCAELGLIRSLEKIAEIDVEALKATNNRLRTPAHIAADKNQEKILESLAAIDQNLLEARDQHNQTPAHIAAINGHVKTLSALASINLNLLKASDNSGRNLAHYASENGHVNVLEFLKSNAPELLRAPGSFNQTPAHIAARKGKKNVLAFLASIDLELLQATNNVGNTPAHYAAEQGLVRILAFLESIDSALLKATSKNGSTPAHIAAEQGHVRILAFLASKDKKLLKAIDEYGRNLAYYATHTGQVKILEYLAFIDPKLLEATDKYGENLAHQAASTGQVKILKYLASKNEYRQLLMAKGQLERTPAHLLCIIGFGLPNAFL